MSTEPETSHWYYAQDGQAIGPLPLSGIRTLAAAGQLAPDAMIAREGTEEWQPLSAVLPDAVTPAAPQRAANDAPASEPEKWYERPLVVIPSLVLCFPVGLAFLWKSRHFTKLHRIGWTVAVAMIFLYALLSGKQEFSPPSQSDGLAADTTKLRLIKPVAWLFVDEKAIDDFEQNKESKTGLKVERMTWENRAFHISIHKKAELLEENGLRGMCRVRIFSGRNSGQNFDLWISPDSLIPYDEQLEKRAAEDYKIANAQTITDRKKRAELVGKIAKVKKETVLLADNDVLWTWLENVEDNKTWSDEKVRELTKSGRAHFIGVEPKTEGLIVSIDGPGERWLQFVPKGGTASNRYWVNEGDVEIRDAPPSPFILEKRLKDHFGKRLRAFAANEIFNMQDKFNVEVRFNGEPGGTSHMIKRSIERDMVEAYRIIYQSSFPTHEVLLFAYLPMTDKYGKTADDIVYKTSLAADEASKVNWKAPETVSFPAVWESRFVLPQWAGDEK